MKVIRGLFAVVVAVALAGSFARAQSAPASEPLCTISYIDRCPAEVFNINNIMSDDAYNNFIDPLRNDLPHAKVSVISSFGHTAILVRGIPDDIAAAQKIITDIDHPKKNYRLTYTVTEMDGTKQIGAQHYAMIMTSSQQTSLHLGNKVPVPTGAGSQQYTYIDIGMNFDATLTEMGENAMLKSSLDDSSVAPQRPDIAGTQQPILRQSTLRGESLLKPGKPLMLGSVDIPGSTSHLDVEVVMENLP